MRISEKNIEANNDDENHWCGRGDTAYIDPTCKLQANCPIGARESGYQVSNLSSQTRDETLRVGRLSTDSTLHCTIYS